LCIYLEDGVTGIAEYDGIGSFDINKEIGYCGNGEYMFSIMEKFWRPDMSEEDLFNTISNV
jgi:20S proteasome alpha/beta subunit